MITHPLLTDKQVIAKMLPNYLMSAVLVYCKWTLNQDDDDDDDDDDSPILDLKGSELFACISHGQLIFAENRAILGVYPIPMHLTPSHELLRLNFVTD